jgi:hypothetical protein
MLFQLFQYNWKNEEFPVVDISQVWMTMFLIYHVESWRYSGEYCLNYTDMTANIVISLFHSIYTVIYILSFYKYIIYYFVGLLMAQVTYRRHWLCKLKTKTTTVRFLDITKSSDKELNQVFTHRFIYLSWTR